MSSVDSTIVHVVDNIKKSDSDSWNYRGLELSNEMLVVLISHPDIDKAAAALDVSVGNLADSRDVPGTAHFLEHMLFMGSSKYPGENEYSKLIEGNGGYKNAFTSGDHTNYYFDINPSLLPEALDVFTQFFISPLFSASSTDRELEAVNSEYEKNLSNDTRRICQLEKSTSDPQHPYAGFGCGNSESLRTTPKQRAIDIRQVLLDFYTAEYSSNRMSLTVLGNQSLDELQSIVMKSFNDVPNKKLERVKYPADPYGESTRKTICYVVPVKEYRCLTINWVIPDHKDIYYCNPESYLSHLIGHEGDGSLLSYLKKLGLATELVSGEKNAAPGFNFFYVYLELTIEGLGRWEKIIHIVYQYIAMLRKEGPKEWIFDERKNLKAMHFQFRENEPANDFVSSLARQMRDYPLTECLSGPYETCKFRPDLIIEELNESLIPSKMRVFLASKEFTSIATEKEKWFGTQYKQEYLPKELIKRCEKLINPSSTSRDHFIPFSCIRIQRKKKPRITRVKRGERRKLIPELHLPKPNEFIPTDFQLFSKEKHSARPQLPIKIKENEFCRLFYGEDTFYRLPKAYLYFELRNPLGSADPLHCNMNALYVELVVDSLTEIVYPAQLGELQYALSAIKYGINLTVYGFNHKIKQLLETIIDRMVNIKVNPQRFEIIKERIKQSLKNFRRDVPYQMAHYGVTYLTAEHQWNKDELLSCIDSITAHDLDSFITRMLTRFFTDSLMYGNLTKDHALEYMSLIEQKFQEKGFYQPLFPGMWFNHRELTLPEGCNYTYAILNDAHKLHAIEIFLQCFQQTLENNALLELFCHFVYEPCFDQLRTKEQLGYIVTSGASRSRGVQGFRVTVQSTRKLDHVNQRIELFIDSIRDYILNMPDDVFKKQREGYIVKKVEIPKSMHSQGNIFWNEITSHQFCFDRPQREVEIIKSLERTDLLRFYDHYISLNSIHRRKLSVHVNPSAIALQGANDKKPIIDEENTQTIIAGAVEHTVKLTEQPPIIDTITDKDSKEKENIISEKQINLPKEEWIDNVHVWKSKLSCYPLTQSYEKIDIPVLYKL
ncbi:unnamed protein product [Adineta steineri]|uniref:Insulin-degrading enzyme n=1 Tax=Adineta steineri TaxID=433720 RepID=A0A814SC39_9BILA|nr:unnamed protein product [Adineta steineri]CAF3765930.1 unnamed protein product [Adineta steineri]